MNWKAISLRGMPWSWIVLGSLLGMGLLLLLILALQWMRPANRPIETAPAALTVILLPTATLLPPTPDTPIATTSPALLSPGVLGIGAHVQVVGTGGDGLRLRSGAGLEQDPLFLGLDGEVFLVIDGPQDVDGYTWYYLSAPYDEARKGWAVTEFLEIVENP